MIDGKYHIPPNQTKPVPTTAQKQISASIVRGYILLSLGSICFIGIGIYIMFAGEIPTEDRIDTLLKYFFPFVAGMIGITIGGRK